MLNNKIGSERGSILVMAVVLSFATILIGMTFLTSAVRLQGMLNGEISRKQAKYDAYAGALEGAADYLGNMIHSSGWKDWYRDNFYDYKIIPQGERDIEYGISTNVRIIGKGKSGIYEENDEAEIPIDLVNETWADFLWLTNRERDSVRIEKIRFWNHDTLDGKVHSNDTIFLEENASGAVFKKRVTTSMNYIDPRQNNARFEKGWGYRGRITFPDQAEEIRRYTGYPGWGTWDPDSITQITFSGPWIFRRYCGRMMRDSIWAIHCDPPYITNNPPYPVPTSGALFVNGKVWVTAARGTRDKTNRPWWSQDTSWDSASQWRSDGFRGQLTLASSDTMIIMDNLIYQGARPNKSVPSSIDSCPDILGLVSENYIMIGEDAGSVVYVNAAMAAIRGSIAVQDIYESIPPGWDNERQSLVIWGSLAQRNRGIVHTTEHPLGRERGFIEKDYNYDIRLKYNPPPHYLKTLNLDMVFWEPL
jgi:hypothetical protein